jgi:hypothetical protein
VEHLTFARCGGAPGSAVPFVWLEAPGSKMQRHPTETRPDRTTLPCSESRVGRSGRDPQAGSSTPAQPTDLLAAGRCPGQPPRVSLDHADAGCPVDPQQAPGRSRPGEVCVGWRQEVAASGPAAPRPPTLHRPTCVGRCWAEGTARFGLARQRRSRGFRQGTGRLSERSELAHLHRLPRGARRATGSRIRRFGCDELRGLLSPSERPRPGRGSFLFHVEHPARPCTRWWPPQLIRRQCLTRSSWR